MIIFITIFIFMIVIILITTGMHCLAMLTRAAFRKKFFFYQQQGSVLGQFLFLIYIKDLPKIAEGSEVILFADDTTICNAEKNCCDSFDSSLNKVDRWFKTNGLCVNPGKTQIMKFGDNFSKYYFAFGTTVQITNVCKYLGIFVDKKLLSNFTLNMSAKS